MTTNGDEFKSYYGEFKSICISMDRDYDLLINVFRDKIKFKEKVLEELKDLRKEANDVIYGDIKGGKKK